MLIMLVGRRDRNNAIFLNVFLTGSSEKHTELKGSRTKKLAIALLMLTLAFSCRQANTKVISEPPLSSLTQTT